MKIYVSGKITGLPRDEAVAKFEEARERLLAQGHEPFVPTVLPDYADVSHGDYLLVCYAMIDICDAVYVLANWRTSAGSHEEIQYAADWRKEIIYEDDATRQDGFPTDRKIRLGDHISRAHKAYDYTLHGNRNWRAKEDRE